jgi:hypothetical protein
MLVEEALVITGFGFTVIVTVSAVPTQFPAVPVGVTVYTKEVAVVVELVIVLLIVLLDCEVVLSPVVFTLSVVSQL